ncbi:uncharacterized protein DUF3558 [Halopolyspora algeriensis]|uniref:Uncharacterized protein DUF3558 n=1 Tax=Halopolyspora algeriensis TaxID=1500506 RepID=A0A368VQH6_9ACTN|nr:uncharacterized protein DUF3558 [Halopolyspora algeriensis]TQM47469.1 uncharacterized protein DUF3558 [Halopolyspora algeriensis]
MAGMVLLSGCGSMQVEVPADTTAPHPTPTSTPQQSTPPAAPVSISQPSTSSLPPRPVDIPLDGIDPCEVLTAQQRGELGFDRDPLLGSEPGFGDAATCSFRSSTAEVGARLSLMTDESMAVWTSDTAQVRTTPVVIAGFPGLVVRTPELDLSCNVAVDIAEGQHLDVLYRDDGANPPPPLNELCAGAKQVAEAAVTSLKDPEPSATTDSAEP